MALAQFRLVLPVCLFGAFVFWTTGSTGQFIPNLNNACFACLCHVATTCDMSHGCTGGYCGPYNISRVYWIDAGRAVLPDDDENRNHGEWTTAYDTVRPLAYQDARIFMLCFNIAEPESLHTAAVKWYREVRTHGGSVPVVLCGCKADLRHDKETVAMLSKLKMHPVTSEEALTVARQLGATTYVETSARASSKGVKDAFEVAALAALGKLNKQQMKQQKQVGRSKSKRDLKAELKGRAKSCCVM